VVDADLAVSVQLVASVAALGVIIGLALYATKVQRGFIKREEAFRVKPILVFSTPYVAVKDLEVTATLSVKNVGRGDAIDINLQIAPTKDYSEKYGGRSRSAKLDRVGIKDEDPIMFDTHQQLRELKADIDGDLLIWGTMKDEEGNEITIKAKVPNRPYVEDLV